MKLFQAIKNALFEEEEPTEQIKITPEMRNEMAPTKNANEEPPKETVTRSAIIDHGSREVDVLQKSEPAVSERELFNTNSNFPFFDFDEKEFEKQNSLKQSEPKPIERPRQANVLEYEHKKKTERRTDYGRYEKIETVETTERRKFKPSPIISPVYGILDKDYVKDDIVQRPNSDKVDIQSVRNKAFGESKELVKEKPVTSVYEETETVTISEPIEKQKKVKTIDELLENTSDITVDLDDDLDFKEEIESFKEEPAPKVEEKKPEVIENEDTLENDLFDLIDSMYSSKEDGE